MFGSEKQNNAMLMPWLFAGLTLVVLGPYACNVLDASLSVHTLESTGFASIFRLAEQTSFPEGVLCWYFGLLCCLPFQILFIRGNAQAMRGTGGARHGTKVMLYSVLMVITGYLFLNHLDTLLGSGSGSNPGVISSSILRNRFTFGVVASIVTYVFPLSAGLFVTHLETWAKQKMEGAA